MLAKVLLSNLCKYKVLCSCISSKSLKTTHEIMSGYLAGNIHRINNNYEYFFQNIHKITSFRMQCFFEASIKNHFVLLKIVFLWDFNVYILFPWLEQNETPVKNCFGYWWSNIFALFQLRLRGQSLRLSDFT